MGLTKHHEKQAGFSYLALLIFIALLGVLAAGAAGAGAALQRRAAEDELLFVGKQFQAAFRMYYASTPSGSRPYPERLSDLLRDPRFPMPRRYLRKVFVDPITGLEKWGLMEAPGGGIMGVYSLSEDSPIRRAGFPMELAEFEGKQRYTEWKFSYLPAQRNEGSLKEQVQ